MSKREARRLARARLAALAPEARRAAGESIARRIWTLPELERAQTLLIYASLPTEVPTEAIAQEAWRRGLVLLFPRCIPQTREMRLHRVDSPAGLREGGSYELREPDPAAPLLPPDAVDVALVPGLAWDRHGRRLGRGAGYYDRLLGDPAWRGFRCGLFFALQEVPAVPSDPWDVPLDAVVTESEVTRFGIGNRG